MFTFRINKESKFSVISFWHDNLRRLFKSDFNTWLWWKAKGWKCTITKTRQMLENYGSFPIGIRLWVIVINWTDPDIDWVLKFFFWHSSIYLKCSKFCDLKAICESHQSRCFRDKYTLSAHWFVSRKVQFTLILIAFLSSLWFVFCSSDVYMKKNKQLQLTVDELIERRS